MRINVLTTKKIDNPGRSIYKKFDIYKSGSFKSFDIELSLVQSIDVIERVKMFEVIFIGSPLNYACMVEIGKPISTFASCTKDAVERYFCINGKDIDYRQKKIEIKY